MLAELLQKYRANANLTIPELSVITGIAEYNLVAFEDATRSPEIDTLWLIASAFGITPKDLL